VVQVLVLGGQAQLFAEVFGVLVDGESGARCWRLRHFRAETGKKQISAP